jgi:quercetin dioxygenase-like cupin family protein
MKMSGLRAYRPKNPKELMMKHLPRLILFALVLIPAVTLSQSNSPQSPVEISGEPRHHPKFENEFVRVWDVTVPARDATLWHAHRNDNVVITFGDAGLRIETLGAAPADSQVKFGDVGFRKATYVHRAMNVGTTPFHNFTIELLKSPQIAQALASVTAPITAAPVFENDRVRVYRTTLDPGQSTSTHTHVYAGLGVTLRGSEVEVLTKSKSGDKTERVRLSEGDVRWRAGVVTHSLKNVGTTRFEAVDIELK